MGVVHKIGYPTKRLIERAEAQSDELARFGEIAEGVAWELDSQLSNVRKDDAGYRRANAANLTGGDNYLPGDLEKASERAAALLLALQPAADLARRWANEDMEAARKAVGHQHVAGFRRDATG